MALYFVSYDLRKEKDYKPLYDELTKLNAVRILESIWCFNRYNTHSAVLVTYLKKFIDSDDGLIVSEVSDWSSYNTDEKPEDLQ